MTRPISCRGARAVGRIVRVAFRMQGRITIGKLKLCAKRVQCSSRNICGIFGRSGSLCEIGLNVPVGTLKRFVDWKMPKCSGWNIVLSVPVGTYRQYVPTGTYCLNVPVGTLLASCSLEYH